MWERRVRGEGTLKGDRWTGQQGVLLTALAAGGRGRDQTLWPRTEEEAREYESQTLLGARPCSATRKKAAGGRRVMVPERCVSGWWPRSPFGG